MRALFVLFMAFSFTANVTFSETFYSYIPEHRKLITSLMTDGKIITKGARSNDGYSYDVLYIEYKDKVYACELRGINRDTSSISITCADMVVMQ